MKWSAASSNQTTVDARDGLKEFFREPSQGKTARPEGALTALRHIVVSEQFLARQRRFESDLSIAF